MSKFERQTLSAEIESTCVIFKRTPPFEYKVQKDFARFPDFKASMHPSH